MLKVEKIDIAAKSDELKQFILDNPELPIVVLTSTDVVADDDYGWWYGCDITYGIENIIVIEDRYYTDKDELFEYICDYYCDDEEYQDCDNETFEKLMREKLESFEPMWTKCICISSDV